MKSCSLPVRSSLHTMTDAKTKQVVLARGHMGTLYSGLVPVRAIGAWCNVRLRSVELRLEVTSNFGAYRKGETFIEASHSFVRQVPRDSIYIYVATIPIDWKDPTPLL